MSCVSVSALKMISSGGFRISMQKCLRTAIWFEEGGLILFLLNALIKTEETTIVHVKKPEMNNGDYWRIPLPFALFLPESPHGLRDFLLNSRLAVRAL